MTLTPRDRALLLDLSKYALHRTRALRDRHFPGVAMTTVLRRLRILEKETYIQRIEGLPNAQVADPGQFKRSPHRPKNLFIILAQTRNIPKIQRKKTSQLASLIF